MATVASSLTPEQTHAALERLLNGPAGSPPDGTIPNFDNPPQNLIDVVYVTAVLGLSFATLAVAIRIYTKHILLRSMGYEDYFSIIAWVSFIGFAVPALLCVRSGAGTHIWDLRLRSFFRMLYWENVVAITYAIPIAFVKLSILLQYLRIFVHSKQENKPLFIAIHACIWSLVVFYLVDTIFMIFLCSPREKIWNPLLETGHCFDESAPYKASGVFNVLSDFAILIVPMPTLWSLQMSLKKKLLVMGVFATGFFACVTSILRSYYSWRTAKSEDSSWELLPMGLWIWAELSIGIIVGCLPTMPKFFQNFGSKIYGNASNDRDGPELGPATNVPKVDVGARAKRSFAKYGVGPTVFDASNDLYSSRDRSHNEYLILDDSMNVSLPGVTPSGAPIIWPGQGIATARNDLEYKQREV